MFIPSISKLTLKNQLFTFLAVLIIYSLFATFGLELIASNHFASPIWMASGIAVGSVYFFGAWPSLAIYLGSALVNYSHGMQLEFAFITASGPMMEAIVGSWLMHYIQKRYQSTYFELLSVLAVAVFASVTSATLGTVALYFAGLIPAKQFIYHWSIWWGGNAVGILIILPLFIRLFSNRPLRHLSKEKRFWCIALTLLIFGLTYLVFVENYNPAYSWSITPILILSGLIIGQFYSRVILVMLAVMLVLLTLYGYAPFEYGDRNSNFFFIQSLLLIYSLATLFVGPLKKALPLKIKYLIGTFLTWGILFLVIHSISLYEKKYKLQNYNKTIAIALDNLNKMSSHYELLLDSSSAIFSIDSKITKVDWKNYVDSLSLNTGFASASGLGFIQRVPREELAALEKKIGQKIKFLPGRSDSLIDDHMVITYIEPLEKNIKSLGFDISQDKSRRVAAFKSLKSNSARASTPVILIQDDLKRSSFVLFHPVWNRKKENIGWTFAPIISSIFFEKSFEKTSHLLQVNISTNDQAIYPNARIEKPLKKNDYFQTKEIELFGTKYLMEFYPTNLFLKNHSGYSVSLALLLNMFVLLIVVFLFEQLTFSHRAEAMVVARTKELEKNRIQLINSSKMASLGEMASGLAHEINNPLAIIQGKVTVVTLMLEEMNFNNPLVIKEINKIKLTAERIEKIVKSLGNFSRASQSDPFEPTSLPKIIQETFDLCSEKLKADGIKVIINTIPKIYITCRPSQISQILINLLSNSVDAILELNQKWIELSFLIEGNTLSIILTDSGDGIPQALTDKIMDPFFTTKEARKGTGLGLSISKSIAEAHGGSLWFDKTHSHTRFILDLKIKMADDFV